MIVYKTINKISAVTFDLDDTLYANWPYIVEAEQHLRAHIKARYPLAAHLSSNDWFYFKREALAESPALKHDMGALRSTTLTKAFLSVDMPSEQIPAAVSDCFETFYFKRSDFSLDKSVHKALRRLARKVPLVAITNGNVNLAQIGIETYFDHVLHAGKGMRMKPYPDMFEAACERLQLKPSQILHVGDNLEKDIWGATRAGFNTAWFAFDRPMNLNNEQALTLPHVQLASLKEIKTLIAKE
ncbi:HAD-IA family hydrolase [Ningiella sp. W23]|uniref:HAD-IA family hydrolase n=1 Tax=Ningiella sp. W23 TaxID=3023715 RepID=UPI0037565AA0